MKKDYYKILIILVAVLILDIISKLLTVHYISYPFGNIPIFQNGIQFSFGHVHNTGGAWGVFNQHPNWLLALRCIFVTGLITYLFLKRTYVIPLALIISGAIGNIIDFFAYGYVIDMIHFIFWGYDYPLFNIADIAIFVGMAWLIILSFGKKK